MTAQANPNFAEATPLFDGIHKYFTVTLPGSGTSFVGTVKFTPANSDDHVIYMRPNLGVSVRDRNGSAVPALLTGAVSGCAHLSAYRVFRLSSASTLAPYRIDLSATTSAVHVALEEVTPMQERWYRDADNDAFGLNSASWLTACVPPPEYDTKQGGDCNDANSAIYPGAPEAPGDGVDSNCDGQDDPVGCSVTPGAERRGPLSVAAVLAALGAAGILRRRTASS